MRLLTCQLFNLYRKNNINKKAFNLSKQKYNQN